MKANKSLPPDLQELIDKYSNMLEEYGFNMPYMDTGFESYNPEDRVLYSSPDKDASSSDWGFKEDAAWRDANISVDEWNSRVDEINDLYNSIIERAVDYMNKGEIEQSAIRDMAASPTYAYDKIFDPSTGRTMWLSHHATDTPQFRSTNKKGVSPMKAIKAWEQPARVDRLGLQKSRPVNLPKVDKELIMRANQDMRTGQEPNYYVIKDGNRKRVRPVEEEELLYYRDKNRIQR